MRRYEAYVYSSKKRALAYICIIWRQKFHASGIVHKNKLDIVKQYLI